MGANRDHLEIDPRALERYLAARLGRPVRVLAMTRLGEPVPGDSKGYGYGIPVRIDYEIDGVRRSAVLETLSPGPFGHEHMADRAQILLWGHRANNKLPKHARSLDVGGMAEDGTLVSLGGVIECFGLKEFVEGSEYAHDLERLKAGAPLSDLDIARSDALCDYLVAIHAEPGEDPGLYTRRIRELVGHGECIMGILDAYPADHPDVDPATLERIEHACVRWRWRLKGRTHRLRQVHGDFHPWNILFRHATEFALLDRARGEWGDPADDVTCLTLNYLFFALRGGKQDGGPLTILFHRFWQRYLEASADREILEVAPPFLAFRGLVMANPLWYPSLERDARRSLIAFVERLLEAPVFDLEQAEALTRA